MLHSRRKKQDEQDRTRQDRQDAITYFILLSKLCHPVYPAACDPAHLVQLGRIFRMNQKFNIY
jgi:hypothetical protein